MKSNAVVRIIIFSIVIIVLLGILLAGIGIGRISSRSGQRWETESSNGTTGISAAGSSGTASENIRDIEIEWVSGTITIQPGDVDRITYRENEVSDSKYKMATGESGSELKIQFCRENQSFFSIPFFGTTIDFSKDLIITVPRDMPLGSLEIEAASTSVIIQDITVHTVELDTASGTCTFTNCSITDLDVDSASGSVTFSGILGSLDFDAASADFRGVLENTPTCIEMDSASGDLDITLPADAGFTLNMDAMSSDFSTDFQTTSQNGNIISGNGACRINVNGMSTDVIIRKAQ